MKDTPSSVKVPRSFHTPAPISATHASAMALAMGLAIAAPVAHAESASKTLATVEVQAQIEDTNPYSEEGAPYKAKISGDQRRVKELAETPHTISVITQKAIEESGKTDLRDILAAQPGVTIGTGENGNAFGDRYIIRGHEARSDVFIDGLRDPGMTTRESFAVEQVEITKGPSSTFAGRGSTGGAVNSITKQPNTDKDFTKLELGVGTDDFHRMGIDTNKVINDRASVRLNLLDASESVPDRAPAEKSRRGLLLSGAFQATDALSASADYYHLEAKDVPDLGTYIDQTTGKPVKNIPVYLQLGSDHLDTDVDTATFKLNYRFNNALRMQNATRIGRTSNSYVATGGRGTTDAVTLNPTVSLSTHQGYQEVNYWVNRTDVFWNKRLGQLDHQFVFGLEVNDEKVDNGTFSATNTGTSNCTVTSRGGGTSPGYCIYDGVTGVKAPNLNTLLGRTLTKNGLDSEYHIRTSSLTAMDTVDFNDKWTGFAGLRYDYFDYTNTVGSTAKTVYDYSDGFLNGHAGVTYKIAPKANVYASVSTSSDINGGESDVGGSCGYGGLCGTPQQVADSKPESTVSYEVGTKWQVLQDKLLMTAALFRTIKSDVQEGDSANSYATTGTLNTGKNQVQGVEFSVVGNITPKLSGQFGLAIMNSEVLESFTAANEGAQLANFAKRSGNLQLKYQATDKFAFGGGATYQSQMFAGQPDTATNYAYAVPSYTVFDAFAEYRFSKQLSARVNVNNVTDKDYYLAAYRSGAFTYIGDKRNAQLTLNYKF